jgi:hypothetical protein
MRLILCTHTPTLAGMCRYSWKASKHPCSKDAFAIPRPCYRLLTNGDINMKICQPSLGMSPIHRISSLGLQISTPFMDPMTKQAPHRHQCMQYTHLIICPSQILQHWHSHMPTFMSNSKLCGHVSGSLCCNLFCSKSISPPKTIKAAPFTC